MFFLQKMVHYNRISRVINLTISIEILSDYKHKLIFGHVQSSTEDPPLILKQPGYNNGQTRSQVVSYHSVTNC